MKKLLFFSGIFFCVLTTDVSALNIRDTLPAPDSVSMWQSYKKKAKTGLVAGTILFTTGAVIATTGFALVLASLNHLFDPRHEPKDYGSLPDILGYGGLLLIGASIPFFILSQKNKKKAKLFLGNKNISLSYPGIKGKKQSYAGIAIKF